MAARSGAEGILDVELRGARRRPVRAHDGRHGRVDVYVPGDQVDEAEPRAAVEPRSTRRPTRSLADDRPPVDARRGPCTGRRWRCVAASCSWSRSLAAIALGRGSSELTGVEQRGRARRPSMRRKARRPLARSSSADLEVARPSSVRSGPASAATAALSASPQVQPARAGRPPAARRWSSASPPSTLKRSSSMTVPS